MGSGHSKAKNYQDQPYAAEEMAQEILNKVSIVRALDPENQKMKEESLHSFLKRRKVEDSEKEKGSSSHAVEEEEEEHDYWGIRGTVYEIPEEPQMDIVCRICEIPTLYKIDGYMCRVCGAVFHKPCLARTGHYTDAEMNMVDRAFSNVGWSCEDCDNIATILKPEESLKLDEAFEKFDVDKDCKVSMKEYLAIRRKLYKQAEKEDMPEEEEYFVKLQFKLLDDDDSGMVDYREFTKHEATKVLLGRDKEDLVGLLTPREKWATWLMFRFYDNDKDGRLCPMETLGSLSSWYSRFHEITTKKKCEDIQQPSATATHCVTAKSNLDDEVDEDKDYSVSWKEFLRNQAIYVIASRPNQAKLNNTLLKRHHDDGATDNNPKQSEQT